MSSNKHTYHTLKSALFMLLMVLVMIISAIPIANQNTLIVQAVSGNGTGDDGSINGKGNWGAQTSTTAFMMYVVDAGGTPLSPSILCVNNNSKILDKYLNKKIIDYNILTKQSPDLGSAMKLSENAVLLASKSDMPYPIDSSNGWKGHGDEIKKYLLRELDTTQGLEKYVFLQIIKTTIINKYGENSEDYGDVWGNIEEGVKEGDYYIIVQPVAMLHTNGDSSGKSERLATTDGWIQWLGTYGHTFTQQAMFNCMHLEYTELGVTKPPRIITNGVYNMPYDELKTTGYGVHIIHMNEGPSNQTTCDEPEQPEPHEPPDESNGPFKIVKSYRIRNTDTNVLTDKGTYVKDESEYKIKIEDESEYKLIAWKTSTTYKPDIVSTQWESTVPAVQKQSGTTPQTIEMRQPETTLYLLLEKPENDSAPVTGTADFIISQSTITRKIKLSYPPHLLSLTTICFKYFNFYKCFEYQK